MILFLLPAGCHRSQYLLTLALIGVQFPDLPPPVVTGTHGGANLSQRTAGCNHKGISRGPLMVTTHRFQKQSINQKGPTFNSETKIRLS